MADLLLERPLAELSRAEKVALIEQVRAERPDLTDHGRASLVGMSYGAYRNLLNDPDGAKQAARRDRYKGVYERCGGETKSDGTSRPSPNCATCAIEIQHEKKVWTRDHVIEAIQAWAAEHGRPPTADDWLHSDPDGRWPNRGSVYRSGDHSSSPFLYWADAIEAAGFDRPLLGVYERTEEWRRRFSEARTVWTREAVVEAIKVYVAWTGEVPTSRDARSSALLPHSATVCKRGWSWADVVREAGFEPRTARGGRAVYWTSDRIIDAIQAWNDAHGAPPTVQQWIAPGDAAYPCVATVIKHFGRWNNAISAAGLTPRNPHLAAAIDRRAKAAA